MENSKIAGVTHDSNQASITINDINKDTSIANDIFKPLSDNKIVVDLIIKSEVKDNKYNLTITTKKDMVKQAQLLISANKDKIGYSNMIIDEEITKISIVGSSMEDDFGTAYTMFSTLEKYGIEIQAISTSEVKISVIIDKKYTELALREVHDAYKLGEED